jgi:hypothetical protein
MTPGNGQLPKSSRRACVDTIGAAHGVGWTVNVGRLIRNRHAAI